MMRFFLCALLLFPLGLIAQVKVYVGEQKFPNELIFELKNDIVYRVTNPALKSEYLFISGDKVYFRDRKSFTDVKYTLTENGIFKGNSSSSFDQLFTLKDNKMYIGDSNFSSDCLYTLKDGLIYKGDSTSSFDAFMSYEIESEEDLILVAMLIAPY